MRMTRNRPISPEADPEGVLPPPSLLYLIGTDTVLQYSGINVIEPGKKRRGDDDNDEEDDEFGNVDNPMLRNILRQAYTLSLLF